MSFSVSVKDTNYEYCGRGLNGIFANKANLFNLKFLKMFFDIINFYALNKSRICFCFFDFSLKRKNTFVSSFVKPFLNFLSRLP